MMYRTASYAEGAFDVFWYEKNLQGDIIAVYNSSGTKLVTYDYYDAWGNYTVSYSNSGATTGAQYNPFKYRGYYYDSDLGMYYLQSRYYDAKICRFISPDHVSIITATPTALTDKNLFAYCDNNPVMRTDNGGMFWGTVFDVVSLAFSVIDVINNPSDVWAWIGLAGDVIDLLPIVSGVGEATDLIRLGIVGGNIIDAADDVYDAARVIDKGKDVVKASERAGAVRKAWKIEFENVSSGGKGVSRIWSDLEIDELLSTGKVKGYQGHHMKSVKGYPKLAGDPNNIQFLTRSEHLRAHGGNFRNVTHGRFIGE